MTHEQRKRAERLAEKKWEIFKETHEPIGQAKFYYSDNAEYWKMGYEACIEDAQVLVDALKEIRAESLRAYRGLRAGEAYCTVYEGTGIKNAHATAYEALAAWEKGGDDE